MNIPDATETPFAILFAGAAQESRHIASQPGDVPLHDRVGRGSVLQCGDHIFALVAEELEGLVEDRLKLRKDRAATNSTAFAMFNLRFRDTLPIHLPIDIVPSQRLCFRRCEKSTITTQGQVHLTKRVGFLRWF